MVICFGVYLEGRHESVHVFFRRFLSANVCIHLTGIGPIRELVGKVAGFLASEALDLDEFPRILLAIIGLHIAVDQVVIIILCKDDGAGECT